MNFGHIKISILSHWNFSVLRRERTLWQTVDDWTPNQRTRGWTYRSWPSLKGPRWVQCCRSRWPWHCTPSRSAGWRSSWCSRPLPRRSPEPVRGLQRGGIIEVTRSADRTEEWVQRRSLASVPVSWNWRRITLWWKERKWHRQENDTRQNMQGKHPYNCPHTSNTETRVHTVNLKITT